MAFRRRRKAPEGAPEGGSSTPPQQPSPETPRKRSVVVRVLTADLVLRAGGYMLRRAVSKGMLRGGAALKAERAADRQDDITTRVVTAAATAIATRSVPGALLVGTGMAVHALYKRGKARRARRQ